MATSKGKTNAQLVDEYNALNPAKPMKAWKGKKEVLIDKINAAKKQIDVPGEKPAKAKKVKASGGLKKTRTGEIREFCEAALAEVDYFENKDKPVGPENILKTASKLTRTVGVSFGDILTRVKKAFPDASTSYACLRWYAVHMRRAGTVLPRRPKSSWK